MADFDLSVVTSQLSQAFRPRVVRTFNASSRLLRLLPIERGEGKNIAWAIETTGAIGENFTDGQDVSNYGIDTPDDAILSWGLYRSSFKVTNLALAAARSSMSPADMLRPMGRSFENACRKLARTVNGVLYSGAGTGTTIAGLATAVDNANTYATIDRGSVTAFRATEFDPGSATDPTLSQIRKDIYDIEDTCGEKPDLAMCPSSVFLKIAALFDSNRQYQQQIINTARGQVMLDASVGVIMIEGCAFVSDPDCTANKIYYLNSNYARVVYLPAANESEVVSDDMIQASLQDQMGPMPLGLNVYPLARTGAARKVTCELQLQLMIEKPSAMGVRHNVNGVS